MSLIFAPRRKGSLELCLGLIGTWILAPDKFDIVSRTDGKQCTGSWGRGRPGCLVLD